LNVLPDNELSLAPKAWKEMVLNPSHINESKVKPDLLIDEKPIKRINLNVNRCPFCNDEIQKDDKVYRQKVALGGSFWQKKDKSLSGMDYQGFKEVKYCWNCALRIFDTQNFKLKINPAMLVAKELFDKGFSDKEIVELIRVKWETVRKWRFRINKKKKEFLKTGRQEWEFDQEYPNFQDYFLLMDILKQGLAKSLTKTKEKP
jgi:hypothetical protein